MLKADIHGVIPALLTPFEEGGQAIDWAACERLCDYLIEKGVHGVFAGGTTGEGMLLAMAERKDLAKRVVKHVKGRMKVIMHTGALNVFETIELTQHARKVGADAVGVVAPYFYTYDHSALLDYFLKVAEAVPEFPVFLYNIPGNAKNELSPDLVAELVDKADNIVGIKHSAGDLYSMEKYADIDGFTVICGNDRLMLPALMAGAKGAVSSTSNSFPEPFVRLYNAFLGGDLKEALRQQAIIRRLTEVMKAGAFVATYKLVLSWKGVMGDSVRCPQRKLSLSEADEIRETLSSEGLMDL